MTENEYSGFPAYLNGVGSFCLLQHAKTTDKIQISTYLKWEPGMRNVGSIYPIKNVITARVRSTTGGYVFTGVCLLNFRCGGGDPI